MVIRGTTGGKCYRLLPEKDNKLHLHHYFTVSYFFIQIFSAPCHSHFTHQRLQFRQLKALKTLATEL